MGYVIKLNFFKNSVCGFPRIYCGTLCTWREVLPLLPATLILKKT